MSPQARGLKALFHLAVLLGEPRREGLAGVSEWDARNVPRKSNISFLDMFLQVTVVLSSSLPPRHPVSPQLRNGARTQKAGKS